MSRVFSWRLGLVAGFLDVDFSCFEGIGDGGLVETLPDTSLDQEVMTELGLGFDDEVGGAETAMGGLAMWNEVIRVLRDLGRRVIIIKARTYKRVTEITILHFS